MLWSNQISSVLNYICTLCSSSSIHFFITKIGKHGLDLFIFFEMVCLYDKRRLVFTDSWFFSWFWGGGALKVRTFSIGETRFWGIGTFGMQYLYVWQAFLRFYCSNTYSPCLQYWSNQCRGHQNNALINEQIITTEQQFKFYSMNDR